ncbi:MAG: hypothetical protein KAI76_01725, partial [Alphaproteobacteria bacterium]|nr:hypothetical protein [Alphaproteobacteria bacterium]
MHEVMEEKYNKKYDEILTALHETNDEEGLEELRQEAANLWREINENLDIEKDNELFTSVYKLDGLIIEKFNEISATSNSNTQTFEPPPADNAKIMEDGQRVKYNEIFDKIEAANSEDDIEELRKASESLVDDIFEKNPDIERDAEKMAALYASMNFLANKINDKGKEQLSDMPGISTVVDTIVPPSQDASSVYPTPVTAPNQ